jgi:prevent-host-death family protein
MTTVASRDLRNHTADVLRQVADGARVTVTVNGRPVAEIGPIRATRPQLFARADFVELVSHHQADPGLSRDLKQLAGDTTDDLDAL